MESQALEVAVSDRALKSLEEIFEYGVETFSLSAATIFIDELLHIIKQLSVNYLLHPECRYLVTKSKMYRNVIYGSYIIIYRIATDRVEVLTFYIAAEAYHTLNLPGELKFKKYFVQPIHFIYFVYQSTLRGRKRNTKRAHLHPQHDGAFLKIHIAKRVVGGIGRHLCAGRCGVCVACPRHDYPVVRQT